VYRVVTDELSQQQIEALPAEALAAVAELRILLEVQPWSGEPLHTKNPHGVQTISFGPHREASPTTSSSRTNDGWIS
jgi:hypothetical protein